MHEVRIAMTTNGHQHIDDEWPRHQLNMDTAAMAEIIYVAPNRRKRQQQGLETQMRLEPQVYFYFIYIYTLY
jgi:hypothetical protein